MQNLLDCGLLLLLKLTQLAEMYLLLQTGCTRSTLLQVLAHLLLRQEVLLNILLLALAAEVAASIPVAVVLVGIGAQFLESHLVEALQQSQS